MFDRQGMWRVATGAALTLGLLASSALAQSRATTAAGAAGRARPDAAEWRTGRRAGAAGAGPGHRTSRSPPIG